MASFSQKAEVAWKKTKNEATKQRMKQGKLSAVSFLSIVVKVSPFIAPRTSGEGNQNNGGQGQCNRDRGGQENLNIACS